MEETRSSDSTELGRKMLAARDEMDAPVSRTPTQGRIGSTTPAMGDRVSYTDPVADNIDPTSPESPEARNG